MDTLGPHRRTSSSDRYLILFSPPPASPKPDSILSKPASEDSPELQEDDIFSTNNGSGSDSSMLSGARSSNNIGASVTAASRRLVNLPDPPSGILALLHDTKQPIASSTASSLHRKATIASATSASTARMIPAPKPKVKDEYAMPHQSAPLNIPVGLPRKPRSGIWFDEAGGGDDYTDMSEMLPPHEIVARRMGNTPLTASSCLEGVGRTLKGRDLRRVRNAVWRQTGFLD
ncbi:Senescence regulator [Carex littledalei]|uniref:Senescence regulator n=1 Tax=Carex littledalei TaxID=544730 RepID=A0A833QLB3_9POAL|nr:Senescence regulator [Carex littledalei]